MVLYEALSKLRHDISLGAMVSASARFEIDTRQGSMVVDGFS